MPNVLLQKFSAPDFTATTKVKLTADADGNPDKSGLVIMGSDYACVYITKKNNKNCIVQSACTNALQKGTEKVNEEQPMQTDTVFLRVKVSSPDTRCKFSYSTDGNQFVPIGTEFKAKPGKWIGAKVGLFCSSQMDSKPAAYADFD